MEWEKVRKKWSRRGLVAGCGRGGGCLTLMFDPGYYNVKGTGLGLFCGWAGCEVG